MVSDVAVKALTAACEACGVSPSVAIESWSKAGYLDDEVMVRRLAGGDAEAYDILRRAGCVVPLALSVRLDNHFRNLKKTPEEMRKRQRTAVPSDKRALGEVLECLEILNDYRFKPQPNFTQPTEQAVYDTLDIMRRSLCVDKNVATPAPEQAAREFIYHMKQLLPDKYINEAKFVAEGVKRPDVIVLSDSTRLGLIELKRLLPHLTEFRLALAQVAVYAACAATQKEAVGRDLRFVVLEGYSTQKAVLIQATTGKCYFEEDESGERYVRKVRYESSPTSFTWDLDQRHIPHYLYLKFVDILQRLFWVGGGEGSEGALVNISGDLSEEEV